MKRNEFEQVIISTMNFVRRNKFASSYPNREISRIVENNLKGLVNIEGQSSWSQNLKPSFSIAQPFDRRKRNNCT